MISPVAKNNVVDAVFNEIMQHIASGEWGIGSKIPSENELTDQLHVSRNSVRQALNRFNALGIIESRHGDGSYVRSVDLSFYLNVIFPMVILSHYDNLNVFQLHRAIQNEAANSACDLATPEQCDELMRMVEQMKLCDKQGDKDGFLKADMRYHVIFAEMTRNPVIVSIEVCISNIMEGPLRSVVYNNVQGDSILFHENIAMALLAKNHYGVSTWMAAHMADVIRKLDDLPTDDGIHSAKE
jgi:GntR family transcriptional regulator, transcriptional repressor for pyruvate dehydrogenase complex